jgi:hypothetical protein
MFNAAERRCTVRCSGPGGEQEDQEEGKQLLLEGTEAFL